MDSISGRVGTFTTASSELNDIQIRRDYGALIEDAVSAFKGDPSYLVDMAEHGSLIAYKRALWEVRMDVQKQEQAARQRCSLDTKVCPFSCTNQGACGFGDCRYASGTRAKRNGELEDFDYGGVLIPLKRLPGDDELLANRPNPTNVHPYRIEDTIAAVLRNDGVAAPARLSKGSRRRPKDAA